MQEVRYQSTGKIIIRLDTGEKYYICIEIYSTGIVIKKLGAGVGILVRVEELLPPKPILPLQNVKKLQTAISIRGRIISESISTTTLKKLVQLIEIPEFAKKFQKQPFEINSEPLKKI